MEAMKTEARDMHGEATLTSVNACWRLVDDDVMTLMMWEGLEGRYRGCI